MSSVVIYKVRASSVSSYQINSEPNRTTQHNKIEGIVHRRRDKHEKKKMNKMANHE